MKKEELIKGKWYKVTKYYTVYFKFNKWKKENQEILMLEYTDDARRIRYDHTATNSAFWQESKLATLDELRSFLPKDHPDLLLTKTYELW